LAIKTASPSRGQARRIYFAFLLVAIIPTAALSGLIGIYVVLDTLRTQTLRNLQQEISVRAHGVGLFFDQLAAEMLYLADASALDELRMALRTSDRKWIGTATALALAKKNGCLACHDLNKKLVGPAWKEVGKKYAGVAGAEEKLLLSVKKGSKDVWGPIPMPPNATVKDADMKTLVQFVLTLK
jgi:cytochrome c